MDKEDQSSKLDKLKLAIKVTAEVTKEASKAILNMGKDIASVFGETVGGTIGKLSKILGDTIATISLSGASRPATKLWPSVFTPWSIVFIFPEKLSNELPILRTCSTLPFAILIIEL